MRDEKTKQQLMEEALTLLGTAERLMGQLVTAVTAPSPALLDALSLSGQIETEIVLMRARLDRVYRGEYERGGHK